LDKLLVFVSVFEAGFGHLLADAAVGDELFLLAGYEVAQHVGCLVYEGYAEVGYILFARPCCLNHLVDGTIAFGQIVCREMVGYVVDYFCNPIDFEFSVASSLF
jgi:hypothetical protein